MKHFVCCDIGGTKIDGALLSDDGRTLKTKHWITSDVKDVAQVISTLSEGVSIHAIGMAIGGPILGRRASLTNLPWTVDADRLQEHFGVTVTLVNDMIAHGYGCVSSEKKILLSGDPSSSGHATIIAPGTGLGEALMVREGDRWIPVPSEGSHASFAPNSVEQVDLLRFAMKQHSHVSAERLISGSLGFPLITAFVAERSNEDREVLQICLSQTSVGAAVHDRAVEGHKGAQKVIDLFLEMLASEASNLALKSLSSGGIYFCGAIPRKLRRWIERPEFVQALTHKGRFSDLLRSWPVYLVVDKDNALQGLRHLLMEGFYSGKMK